EPCERLAGPEDLLVVLQLEGCGGTPPENACSTDEREGSVRRGRWPVAQTLRGGQEIPRCGVQLGVPRDSNGPKLTESTAIAHDAVPGLRAPRAVGWHGTGEHERIGVAARVGWQITREEPQPHGARTDEGDLEGQGGVAVVLGAGELGGLRA